MYRRALRISAVLLAVVLLLSCHQVKAITPRQFFEKYNSDVLKQSEFIDFDAFKKISTNDGNTIFKTYIMDDMLLAEYGVDKNKQLSHFGVLALITDEKQIDEKSKLLGKVATRVYLVTQPDVSLDKAWMALLTLIQQAASEGSGVHVENGHLYEMVTGDYAGIEAFVFIYRPVQ